MSYMAEIEEMTERALVCSTCGQAMGPLYCKLSRSRREKVRLKCKLYTVLNTIPMSVVASLYLRRCIFGATREASISDGVVVLICPGFLNAYQVFSAERLDAE